MTKQEKDKCEKLLNEAAMNLNRADIKWKNYEDAKEADAIAIRKSTCGILRTIKAMQKGFIRH